LIEGTTKLDTRDNDFENSLDLGAKINAPKCQKMRDAKTEAKKEEFFAKIDVVNEDCTVASKINDNKWQPISFNLSDKEKKAIIEKEVEEVRAYQEAVKKFR
jgi:hypothetical protein